MSSRMGNPEKNSNRSIQVPGRRPLELSRSTTEKQVLPAWIVRAYSEIFKFTGEYREPSLFKPGGMIPEVSLVPPGNIYNFLTDIKQDFDVIMQDPTIDPKLKSLIEFFTFQLRGYSPERKPIIRDDRSIKSPGEQFRFQIAEYISPQYIPELGCDVSAVVPTNLQITSHEFMKRCSTDLFEVMYATTKGSLNNLYFRDPLLGIPKDCSPKIREKIEESIEEMIGFWVEMLFDLQTSFNIVIVNGRQTPIIKNFIDFLNDMSRYHPSAPFMVEQTSIYSRDPKTLSLGSYFDRAILRGVRISFTDEKQMVTVNRADANGSDFIHELRVPSFTQLHPNNHGDILITLERLMRKRFNQNFQKLRHRVAEVSRLVYEEAFKGLLKRKGIEGFNKDEKQRLKNQIYAIYASWLLMTMTVYNQVFEFPVQSYISGENYNN